MYTQISTEAARNLIREKSPVILDVRDMHAFSDARIPNAIHVTLSTIKSAAKQYARETPLLVYCYRGHASRDFAELFSDFGFREVYSLEGGFHAWHASKAEIERPMAAPPVVVSDPMTDWLLDQGGDPDNPNSLLPDGSIPLIKACQQGQAGIAEALLAAGADVYDTDNFGNDALWAACYSEDLATIGVLMDAGVDRDRQNRVGATALIYAASAGKTDVVAFLLESGADATLKTEDDFTALELAANIDILRLLRSRTRSAA